MVAKLHGDKSASQSSMELYYPWISGPLHVCWVCSFPTPLRGRHCGLASLVFFLLVALHIVEDFRNEHTNREASCVTLHRS